MTLGRCSWVFFIASLAAMAACSVDSSTPDGSTSDAAVNDGASADGASPDASQLPPISVDASKACTKVGPQGGTVTHATRAQIVIPAGALDSTIDVCFEGIAPGGDAPLGQGFAATPSGQVFRKPIDIAVPFDATRLPAGSTLAGVGMRMAPDGSNAFVWAQATADLTTGMVHTQSLHFTQFVPALNATPIFITTSPSLPQATAGVPYSTSFTATGGASPYTWTLPSPSIAPPGLALATAGTLAGTPTTPNAYSFFVAATDANGHSVQLAASLTVAAPNNPVPVLTQVTPTAADQGSSATTIALTGSLFASSAAALFDGVPMATTFNSATQLSAVIPASSLTTAGTHLVSVSNPAPGGGTSGTVPFIVNAVAQNPLPVITSVAPSQIPTSAIDTQVTITGSSFIASTSAAIGTQLIPTSFVSSTQLLASIPAANLATYAILQIGAYTPSPGGGFSASTVSLTVGAPNPAPTLTSLSPSSITTGSPDFTLTATGTGFVQGGQLFFGITALPTTITSATSASATIAAGLVSQSGTAQVAFVSPAPGGGTSGSVAFTISPVSDAGASDATVGDSGGAQDAAQDTNPLDASDGGPTPTGVQEHPAILFDGTTYVAAWHDVTKDAFYYAHIATDGTVLDRASLGGPGASKIAIGYDGTNYLFVWDGLEAVSMSKTGTKSPLIAFGTGGTDPHVAFDGTQFLVTYHTSSGLMATRISTSGVVLDPNGITISSAGKGNVACDPTGCFVAAQKLIVPPSPLSSYTNLALIRVDPSGAVGAYVDLHEGLQGVTYPMAIAFGAGEYLLADSNYDNSVGAAAVKAVSPSGVISATVADSCYVGGAVDVTFDGTSFQMVCTPVPGQAIYSVRFNPQTRLVNYGSILYDHQNGGGTLGVACASPGRCYMVWDHLPGPPPPLFISGSLMIDGVGQNGSGVVLSFDP